MNLGIADDYVPSDGELDNLVYLVLKYTVGWPMRPTDKLVCLTMAGPVVGTAGIENLIRQTCEYAWDHIAGEPDEFSPDDLYSHMAVAIEKWYASTSVMERADTGAA